MKTLLKKYKYYTSYEYASNGSKEFIIGRCVNLLGDTLSALGLIAAALICSLLFMRMQLFL